MALRDEEEALQTMLLDHDYGREREREKPIDSVSNSTQPHNTTPPDLTESGYNRPDNQHPLTFWIIAPSSHDSFGTISIFNGKSP